MIIDSDMQGGIAHAGPVRFQRAAWFSGDDYLIISNSTSGVLIAPYFVCILTIFCPTSAVNRRLISDHIYGSQGWEIGQTYNNSVFFTVRGVNYYSPQTAFPGTHVIALAVSTAKMRLWLDGSLKREYVGDYSVTYNLGYQTYIGRYWPSWEPKAVGVIRHVKMYNAASLTDAQIDAIIDGTDTRQPEYYVRGDGITDADWIDIGSEGTHDSTVYGSHDIAYIRGDGKIIVAGEIKNP